LSTSSLFFSLEWKMRTVRTLTILLYFWEHNEKESLVRLKQFIINNSQFSRKYALISTQPDISMKSSIKFFLIYRMIAFLNNYRKIQQSICYSIMSIFNNVDLECNIVEKKETCKRWEVESIYLFWIYVHISCDINKRKKIKIN